MSFHECHILTALPDSSALLREAGKAGLNLKDDEHLNDYSIKCVVDKDTCRIHSIESHIEFMMNVQGLMSPVSMNQRIDIYNYDSAMEIEAPFV